MASFHKNIQLLLGFLNASSLVLHFSYYTLIIFLKMLSVILLSMLMKIIYSKCDQASDLESDLQDTVDCGKKWLVDFNAAKT